MRVNAGAMRFEDAAGRRIGLLDAVRSLESAGCVGSWPVTAAGEGSSVPGRVRALRRSETAVRTAQRKPGRDARRKGRTARPETPESAKYAILSTTFPESGFTAEAVLGRYRLRWRAGPAFRRFRSVAKPGHPPKRHDGSPRAWLCGKPFTALLAGKLTGSANTLSPRGCSFPTTPNPQRMARVQVRPQSGHARDRTTPVIGRRDRILAGTVRRTLRAAPPKTPADRTLLRHS